MNSFLKISEIKKLNVKDLRTYVTSHKLFKNLGNLKKGEIIDKIIELNGFAPEDEKTVEPTTDKPVAETVAEPTVNDQPEGSSERSPDNPLGGGDIHLITSSAIEYLAKVINDLRIEADICTCNRCDCCGKIIVDEY
jgi:hypothetical protein